VAFPVTALPDYNHELPMIDSNLSQRLGSRENCWLEENSEVVFVQPHSGLMRGMDAFTSFDGIRIAYRPRHLG
jgi:hypothetical protein